MELRLEEGKQQGRRQSCEGEGSVTVAQGGVSANSSTVGALCVVCSFLGGDGPVEVLRHALGLFGCTCTSFVIPVGAEWVKHMSVCERESVHALESEHV